MKRSCRGWLVAVFMAYLVVTVPAYAAAPMTYVTIEPAQIMMGDSAQLTITSLGADMPPVPMPVVPGLNFEYVGQSRRIEFVNGTTLASTSIVVRVTPQIAGIYTIPRLTPKSEPLVLRVDPEKSAGNSSRSGGASTLGVVPNVAGGAPNIGGGSTAGGIHMTADGSAFVRMNVPKKEVYVGESVPVEIEVGMRAGFVTSLNGLPTLTAGDFTLNSLSRQPERVETLISGEPFTVLTWHSVLAAVKPGSFSLSVDAPLTVRIRTQPRRESMLDDLLGDPFLQNYFGATVPKDITVASPPAQLTVLALPTKGRPPEFSGAVGTFKIASEIAPKSAAAGDPLTLRMRVTGAGNFDRVDTPMLEHADQWKTYPPKSSFSASDATGYKGEKTFEQPLIASKSGSQNVPGLTFSFFDPSTRRYETAQTAPLSVTILPSLADSAPSTQAAAGAAATAANQSHSGLRPDHVESKDFANSLVPLYLQPRFLALPSLLVLAFAGGWLGLRRRASDSSDRPFANERAVSKATHRVLAQLESAARSGDPSLFFHSARSAVLQSLAARWQLAPNQIMSADVDTKLGSEHDELRQLFALADEARYSGHELTTPDFERWTRIVRRYLVGEQAT